MRNRQNLLRNKSLTFWGHLNFLALCRDNEKVFLDKDKYVVQGYGITGVVNAHGIIRF